MEIAQYISSSSEVYPDFKALKTHLQGAPLHLEVRESDDLFTLMFTDKSPAPDPIVNECVGCIFEKGSNRLVSYAFDRTQEIILDPSKQTEIPELAQEDVSKCHIVKYIEGVKLTMFHHDGRWRLATNRRIDAFQAFWGSHESFGDQFVRICQAKHAWLYQALVETKETAALKPDMCYSFVLQSQDNRIVVHVSTPEIYHIATFDRSTMEEVAEDIGIAKPSSVSFANTTELLESMMLFNYWNTGYIIRGQQRYKVFFSGYNLAKQVKGNNPNMFQQCLELRQDQVKLQEFLAYFPEYVGLVRHMEHSLRCAAASMYQMYVAFYIQKQPKPWMEKVVFVTLCQIHGKYLESKVKRNFTNIYSFITSLPIGLLNQLLTVLNLPPACPV